MKLYRFLTNKGSFVKAGMVQKLSKEKAEALLAKGIIEPVEEVKPKGKPKAKAKTSTKTIKGD